MRILTKFPIKTKNALVFCATAILFNLLFFHMYLYSIFYAKLPIKSIVGHWIVVQYYFSYSYEFMKRAFVGSLFDTFNIPPTPVVIFLSSIVIANVFWLIFYAMARAAFKQHQEKAFLYFIGLALFSPAVAMHLGFDNSRYDHINLVLMLVAVLLLRRPASAISWTGVCGVVVVGTLTHEAFLFICLPLLLAITYREASAGRQRRSLVVLELAVAGSVTLALLLHGKASAQTFSILQERICSACPREEYTMDALQVLTRDVKQNIDMTIAFYTSPGTLGQILLLSPLVAAYVFLYFSVLDFRRLAYSQKLVALSPFCIVPLFFLGTDFARWISMLVTLMFVSVVYLVHEGSITLICCKRRAFRFAMLIVVLHTAAGPIGVVESFPFAAKCVARLLGGPS